MLHEQAAGLFLCLAVTALSSVLHKINGRRDTRHWMHITRRAFFFVHEFGGLGRF